MSEINFKNMDTVLVTYGINGYPKNVERMISAENFNDTNELFEFAEEHNLDVMRIYKKDGWKFWENRGVILHEYEITGDDFGEDFMVLKVEDKEDLPGILGCSQFSDMEFDDDRLNLLGFIFSAYRVLSSIEEGNENKYGVLVNTVKRYQVNEYDIVELYPLEFCNDGQCWSYAIKFPKNK